MDTRESGNVNSGQPSCSRFLRDREAATASHPYRVVLAGGGQDVLAVRMPVQSVDLGEVSSNILHSCVGFLLGKCCVRASSAQCGGSLPKGPCYPFVPDSDIAVVTGGQAEGVPLIPLHLGGPRCRQDEGSGHRSRLKHSGRAKCRPTDRQRQTDRMHSPTADSATVGFLESL